MHTYIVSAHLRCSREGENCLPREASEKSKQAEEHKRFTCEAEEHTKYKKENIDY
jgi:hypothetical protein